jgi:hypothetical protein
MIKDQIKDYIKDIKEWDKAIQMNNIASVTVQYRYKQYELSQNLHDAIDGLADKLYAFLTKNTTSNNLTEKDLEGKKLFFFNTGKFSMTKLKELFTLVKSPAEADIVIYDSFGIRLNTIQKYCVTELNQSVHYIDNGLNVPLINKCYDLIQNKNCICVRISSLNLSDNTVDKLLNQATKDIITPEVQQSLTMMLKSSDLEMFNLGWKSLWQYNYVTNKDTILLIFGTANRKSLKDRVKSKSIEYAFKQWKKYWTIFY